MTKPAEENFSATIYIFWNKFSKICENMHEEFYWIFGYVTRQNTALLKNNTMLSVIADLRAVI